MGADLAICEDFVVRLGSLEAQPDQLLLEGGVHVHCIGLLTLSLQAMTRCHMRS